MSYLENRYVINLTLDLVNLGITQNLYFVGKENVNGSSVFKKENIDFAVFNSVTDLNQARLDNFTTLTDVSTNNYDLVDIQADVGNGQPLGPNYPTHTYYTDNINTNSRALTFSGRVSVQSDTVGLPFVPDTSANPLPYDLEFVLVIDDSNAANLTFDQINASNTLFSFYYETYPGSTKLSLEFSDLIGTSLQGAIPTLNSWNYQIAYTPTVSVVAGNTNVAFTKQNTFELTDLFNYKRSYKVLTSQTTFDTYEFLNLRNKLQKGVRK